VNSGQKVGRIIICGSAGVYGQVEKQELPVKETTPLRASSPYALSKKAEEDVAISLGEKYKLPVTIARIFNPIGRNMGQKFLITSLLNQVKQLQSGERNQLEVSRLDSERDYVAVEDIAHAIRTIAQVVVKEVVEDAKNS
jgi:GDP-4-dehydro-6-deoxy-D-mannose reductase